MKKWIFCLFAITVLGTACQSVKPYQRAFVNDHEMRLGKKMIHRFEGQVTIFDPKRGPTYRDMVPRAPAAEVAPSCAEAGVLGALPGVIGAMQALEAIKLTLEVGDPLIGRMVVFNALDGAFHELRVASDPTNQITWANRAQVTITDQ